MAKMSMARLSSLAGLSFFFQSGQPLLLMPLAIGFLSTAESALWLYWGVITSFAMICDVGLKPTIARAYVYAAEQKPGCLSVKALEKLSTIIYSCLFIISFLVSVAFAHFSADNLINATSIPRTAFWATLILCLSLSINLASLGLKAKLQGLGGQHLEKTADLTFNLSRTILVAAAIISTQNLLIVALAYLLSSVILWLLAYWSCQKLKPVYKSDCEPHKSAVIELFCVTGKTSILQISAFIVYNAVSIYIAQGNNPELIAATLVTVRFFMIAQQLSMLPLGLIMPDIAARWTQHNNADIYHKLQSIVVLCLLSFCGFSMLLYGLGNPLLSLLGKKMVILQGQLFLILFVAYFLEIHHSIHASFYMQQNKVPFASIAIGSGALIIVLGWLFRADITVLLLVQLGVQAATNNWYPVYKLLRALQVTPRQYLSDTLSSLRSGQFIQVMKTPV